MKRALSNIDYTVDFVTDEGALICGKPSQELENTGLNVLLVLKYRLKTYTLHSNY